ncbi:lymphocyte cytosolic protein 2-like isoform X2 [Pseudomyrmex gracilis]|nr:lymphocyte cytosolic protein 2-like isoform X2 [Pseudomyrmex gracilis]
MQQSDDHLSDNESWGTDWEDEPTEESNSLGMTQECVKPNSTKQACCSQKMTYFFNRIPSEQTLAKSEHEETYANCESCQNEEENTYTNLEEMKAPTRNVSELHSQIEKTLEKQSKEMRHKNNQSANKPTLGPKPKTLPSKKIPVAVVDNKPLQKSFLHNESKSQQPVSNEHIKTQKGRMTVPPPPEPKKNYNSAGSDKELVKRPTLIRHLDLVANLPTRTKESEDEYETFDENVIEQAQSKKEITRVDSKLSLHSGRSIQGSVESVYKPPSATSHEEEEDYELYESITEIEDSGYLSPIKKTNNVQSPPPLPAKPSPSPPSSTSSFDGTRSKENSGKRSPDKKSATLPHAGSNTSLLPNERATRPLPLLPDRQSYTDKPWYHNVTREQAIALIGEQDSYNNPQDGYFLLRPSTTKVRNPFVLVLWYKDRVYNVPVRKRNDNRYALGSQKVGELFFSTIEEIITYHMKHELMLESGGVPIGSTILTDTPSK